MNKWDYFLFFMAIMVLGALWYGVFDMREEAKECLRFPLQYWIKNANEETGKDFRLTVSAEGFNSLLITEDNITSLHPAGLLNPRRSGEEVPQINISMLEP